MAGGDVVEIRYLLERGRVLNSSGQPEQTVPLFKQAVEIGQRIGTVFHGRCLSQKSTLECLALLAERNSPAAIQQVKGNQEETVLA